MTEGEYQAIVDPPTPAIWKTRDGREIPIVEMDDAHLVNTLRMLRRKFVTADEFNSMWAGLSMVNGEMAQYALEEEIASAQVMPRVFDHLVAEASYRGLSWEVSR